MTPTRELSPNNLDVLQSYFLTNNQTNNKADVAVAAAAYHQRPSSLYDVPIANVRRQQEKKLESFILITDTLLFPLSPFRISRRYDSSSL